MSHVRQFGVAPISILVASEHILFRAGLISLITDFDQMTVIGEAGDDRELHDGIAELSPHVVVADQAMPRLNGLNFTRLANGRDIVTRIVVISMNDGAALLDSSRRAGVQGFLSKDAGLAELELAIRGVNNGDDYFCPMLADVLRSRTLRPLAEEKPALTPRQREVLQLVAEGHTSSEIGAILFISVRTVQAHRRQIMLLLDIHHLAGLVRYSIREGLIAA